MDDDLDVKVHINNEYSLSFTQVEIQALGAARLLGDLSRRDIYFDLAQGALWSGFDYEANEANEDQVAAELDVA